MRVGRPRLARKPRSGICIAIVHVCEVGNSERVPAGWIDGTHGVAPAACNIREIQDRWTAWICGSGLLGFWKLMC
jgi:hypothetical protein